MERYLHPENYNLKDLEYFRTTALLASCFYSFYQFTERSELLNVPSISYTDAEVFADMLSRFRKTPVTPAELLTQDINEEDTVIELYQVFKGYKNKLMLEGIDEKTIDAFCNHLYNGWHRPAQRIKINIFEHCHHLMTLLMYYSGRIDKVQFNTNFVSIGIITLRSHPANFERFSNIFTDLHNAYHEIAEKQQARALKKSLSDLGISQPINP